MPVETEMLCEAWEEELPDPCTSSELYCLSFTRLWRLETFGLPHQLIWRNLTEVAHDEGDEIEDESVSHQIGAFFEKGLSK